MAGSFNNMSNMGGLFKTVYGKPRMVSEDKSLMHEMMPKMGASMPRTDTKNMMPVLPNRPRFTKLKNILKTPKA